MLSFEYISFTYNGRIDNDKKEHQELLKFGLAALGYIPPQTDEELQAFYELHKYYVPRIKDMHVDVNKIISGEIKCE